MVATTHIPQAAAPVHPVRRITSNDLRLALREGWEDFLDKRGDLLFIGFIYPAIGLVTAAFFLEESLLPFFFPVTAGVALLGPIAATGFYELARRREAGEETHWSDFLSVRERPGFDEILTVAALLVVIFGLWIAVAAMLYLALMGPPPETLGGFLGSLFTTPGGWALILLGNLAGLGFATLVLALSVVSFPLLVDRDGSARRAVDVSIAAFRENPAVLLRWGAIIVLLLVLGSIPAFVGLAVVLPWLGYATWHLYTKLVDRAQMPHGEG